MAEVSMNQLLEAGYTSLDLLRQATDEELSDKLAISDSRIADLRFGHQTSWPPWPSPNPGPLRKKRPTPATAKKSRMVMKTSPTRPPRAAKGQ